MAPPRRIEALANLLLLCVLLVSHSIEPTKALQDDSSVVDNSTVRLPGSIQSQIQPTKEASGQEIAAHPAGGSESQETTTSQQTTTTTAAATTTTTSTAADKASDNSEYDKKDDNSLNDIKSLLANKNDSENDLAATSNNKPTDGGLDSPVDAVGQSSGGNRVGVGNRFHYSLGAADSDTTITTTTTATESGANNNKSGTEITTGLEDKEESTTQKEPSGEEIFELHEDNKSKSPAPADTSSATSSTTTKSTELPSSGASSAKPNNEGETEIKYDEKTKSIVVESAPKKEDEKSKEPQSTTVSVKEVKVVESTTTESAASSTTTPAPISTELATKASDTSSKSEKSVPTESNSVAPTATSITTTSTTTTGKPPLESSKPVDVPSVVAAAVGSAIGSAVGSAIKPMLAARDKPVGVESPSFAKTTTTTTSTQKPTTLKSSSDRWNRWSPSTPSLGGSGSSTPPTRRRPILPSIRRRFRPYNRLSPFPFGVDTYNSDIDRDSLPADQQPSSSFRPSSTSSTTKPKRRSSTTSTTESPKSSPGRNDDDDNDADDNRDERPTSSRRGENGPGHRRRHNHHHHHRYNQHHHNNNNDGEFNTGHRRRQHNNHGQHTSTNNRHFGRGDESFHGLADMEPSYSRPNPNGFSLFNTGSAGSGFDLLNPFSGWLDDSLGGSGGGSSSNGRPARGPSPASPSAGGRPVAPSHIGSPGRLPGRNPIAVEGEYNEPHQHGQHPAGHGGRDTHIHVHGGNGGRPIVTGVGGDRDREDYDNYGGHHGHDCHDHDYDHDHHDHHRDPPYRPGGRPGRDPYRPTYGGEDSYRPNRPNRPYNRRDESELGSTATSTSSATTTTTDKHRERERGHTDHSDPTRPEPSSAGAPSHHYSPANGGGPKRVPSIFSPFESLFGALDDELFSLRSTFIDGTTLRSTPIIKPPQTFVDTIISSPKISVPPPAGSAAAPANEADKLDDPKRPTDVNGEPDEDSSSSRSGRRLIKAFG